MIMFGLDEGRFVEGVLVSWFLPYLFFCGSFWGLFLANFQC